MFISSYYSSVTKDTLSMCRVVVGEHNYTDPGDGQVEAAPSVWSSHPLYDKITNNYDLAIVTLASSLALSSSGH